MFKDIDPKWLKGYFKKMEEINEGYTPRKIELGAWQEWYAWRPVKMKGKYVWLKKIYRRCINTYVDQDDWTRYEYGTAFDVIKGDDEATRYRWSHGQGMLNENVSDYTR